MTSFESGQVYFRTMVSDEGLTFKAKADTLAVNPYYEREAQELIRSPLRFDTTDNAVNVYKGVVDIKVFSRITAATWWCLLAKKNDLYDAKVYTSMEPNIIVKDAPDNSEDTVVLSHQKFAYGHGDARTIYCGDT